MTAMLERTGVSSFIWEDWVDTTLGLLDNLSTSPDDITAFVQLESAFNDAENSPCFISHLRVRSSSDSCVESS